MTWFKLPLLPSAVRISLVYPLQLLLYIPMKTSVWSSSLSPGSVFQSHWSCSYFALLGSSLLRWLYIRRSFVCQIQNFKRGFSGRAIYLFPQPLSKLLSWKHGVSLLLCRVLRIQPACQFHQDFTRTDSRKETDKRTGKRCEMGFEPMWLLLHGAVGKWAEGTMTKCCVFECARFVQAKSNLTVLGFSILVVKSPLWGFLPF